MPSGWRDSRFGQFADPNFGANIYGQQKTQGVLPAGGQDMSASSFENSGVVDGSDSGASDPYAQFRGQVGPGLLPGNPGDPKRMWLEDGGAIPDEDPEQQDSGNATMPAGGGMDVIRQALSYGRKKMGLPENFFGTEDTAQTPGEKVNKAAEDEGATGQIQDDDIREFQGNQMLQGLNDGDSMAWGKMTTPPKQPDTQWLAEGGSVEDESEGVIPTEEGATQSGSQRTQSGVQPGKPQQQLGYLMGSDGMPADMAMAMEQRADPAGRMDPNMRKFLAVQSAGSPDRAWGLMQHYRQRFNAYNGFARAAATGSEQKPADLMASAKAATQAYENLPDGNAVMFQPVQGGMKVAIRKIIPSKPAPSGGEKPPPTQSFAEGGSVEDDEDFNYETAGARPWAGIPADIDAQEDAAQGDAVTKLFGGREPHEALREFVLSIPQYLGFLKDKGQADAVYDKGIEAAVHEATQADIDPNIEPPAQGQPDNDPANAPGRQYYSLEREQAALKAMAETAANNGYDGPDGGDQMTGRAQPQGDAAPQGGQGPDREFKAWAPKGIDPEIAELGRRMFPYVSQERERMAMMADAMQKKAERESKENVGRIKGEMSVEGRRIAGEYGLRREGVKQEHGDARADKGIASKERIATGKEQGAGDRARLQAAQKVISAAVMSKPGILRDPEALQKFIEPLARQYGISPQQAMQMASGPGQQSGRAQGQPQAQLPPAAASALKEGQVTTFKNGQRWTLQGGQPVQVQ